MHLFTANLTSFSSSSLIPHPASHIPHPASPVISFPHHHTYIQRHKNALLRVEGHDRDRHGREVKLGARLKGVDLAASRSELKFQPGFYICAGVKTEL